LKNAKSDQIYIFPNFLKVADKIDFTYFFDCSVHLVYWELYFLYRPTQFSSSVTRKTIL